MDNVKQELVEALHQALINKDPIAPLTESHPNLSIADAYEISVALLQRRIEAGAKVVGKKIGLTNTKVQEMLGVDQPDFGFVTNDMVVPSGSEVSVSQNLIQPKIEGELVFMLKETLQGPGITNADVMRATEYVIPALEIVDSRVADWKIKIQDTIADNASSGMLVLGDKCVGLDDVDVLRCGVVLSINGTVVDTGVGAAAAGSPINAVAWLANTLGELGMPLEAGEVVLSGALVKMFDVTAGDHVRVDIGNIGSCSVVFTE